MRVQWLVCSFSALLIASLALVSQPAPPERVGPLAGGGFLLNSGWRLAPAGTQVQLDTFPMSSALSPDGRYLLVLNGGYNPPSISVLDTASVSEIARVPVADAWLGLAFSPKGDRVYVGGALAGIRFRVHIQPRRFAARPHLRRGFRRQENQP